MKLTIRILIINMLALLLHTAMVAQDKGLHITDNETAESRFIKENKRIRIKTIEGDRITGNFIIIDADTILIDENTIALSSVAKIKRHPRLYGILVGSAITYLGIITVSFSVLIAVLTTSPEALILLAPAAGLIYGGLKAPNILKGYKTQTKYSITIGANESLN
jgi:hypothetical protein